MSAYTKKSGEAVGRYLREHREECRFWVRKGEIAKMKQYASEQGYPSLSRFLIDCVNKRAGFDLLETPAERAKKREE